MTKGRRGVKNPEKLMTSFMSAAYGRPVDIKPRNDEKNKKK